MIEKIISIIAPSGSDNYKCYDTLRYLLQDEKFLNIISIGIKEGKITGFSESLWQKLASQNIRAKGVNSFLEVLRDGYNQGYCTVCSKQVSYSLDNPYICGGVLPVLKGTTNSPDGSHTWILDKGYIIDTTLMLVIEENYAKNLGYIEENRYNPNIDPIYMSTKEYTCDKTIRKN